ncbi:hypothetical protein DFQ28_005771 [Apophysomyces sp. BC1034]|nr:hypothetical protein DFQ30_005704 [Apophysomyces sp. BC1015]KAG0177582.1 hypothetical protein DFQ29_004661 [Apophysomyces sp. BC1021]KAG0187862.1 hypothetical protein DFQ28_005771 [Apophysomyces sp. BC1034]
MFSPVLKRSLTAAAATAAVATSLSQSTVVYAEEEKRSKLSIYDPPQPKVVIVESPTKLEEHVAFAQQQANKTLEEGKTHVNTFYEQCKQFEKDVKDVVKETVAQDEEVLPNALYVGVAALAGTIIARNRNIVLRFLTSTAMAAGTSFYLLPKTTHNVGVQFEKLERKYPELQEAHRYVDGAVGCVRKEVDGVLAQLRGTVNANIEQLQQSADKIKDQVGGAEAKSKFDEVKKSVESMYSTRSNPGVEETLKKNN